VVPTPRGDVAAGWQRRPDGGMDMSLTLPKGVTAEVWAQRAGATGSIALNGVPTPQAGKISMKCGGRSPDLMSPIAERPAGREGGPGYVILVLRGGKTYHITSRAKS